MPAILKESLKSLFLEAYFGEQRLGTATGFLVGSGKGLLLVTNRHVVTGRHQDDGRVLHSLGGIPDRLIVRHNALGMTGGWITHTELLYVDDEPRWLEHPTLKSQADVVAIPISQDRGVEAMRYEPYAPGVPMPIGPTDLVSVIGYPFGQMAGGMAIWSTGSVASEPDLEEPTFLIDCRSRTGQSGSPVVGLRTSGFNSGGGMTVYSGPVSRFFGIYSGRINKDSDIGTVWKPQVIGDIVQAYAMPEHFDAVSRYRSGPRWNVNP